MQKKCARFVVGAMKCSKESSEIYNSQQLAEGCWEDMKFKCDIVEVACNICGLESMKCRIFREEQINLLNISLPNYFLLLKV